MLKIKKVTKVWYLRWMLRISWKDSAERSQRGTVTNTKITIRKRQMQLLGLLDRRTGLDHFALTGKHKREKGRGGSRKTY